MTRLERLKEAAKAADRPGPWMHDPGFGIDVEIAAYFAKMRPATGLDLIELVKAQHEALEALAKRSEWLLPSKPWEVAIDLYDKFQGDDE